MTIILLDCDRLKICLNENESLECGFNEDYSQHTDEEIRARLLSLLKKAHAETGFNPGSANIVAEIWPDESGGCVVCFTAVRGIRLSPYGGEIEPIVYSFESALELIRAMCDLYSRYGHYVYKSSLYTDNRKYLLVMRVLDYEDQQSIRLLEEYTPIIGRGEVLAAYIDEHCELLLSDNAVDTVGEKSGIINQFPE